MSKGGLYAELGSVNCNAEDVKKFKGILYESIKCDRIEIGILFCKIYCLVSN